ncbi:MAG: hypothetical protein WAU34_08840, partial [Desulfobacterales bacterium]
YKPSPCFTQRKKATGCAVPSMGLSCAFVAMISVLLSLNPQAFMARHCNTAFLQEKNSGVKHRQPLCAEQTPHPREEPSAVGG